MLKYHPRVAWAEQRSAQRETQRQSQLVDSLVAYDTTENGAWLDIKVAMRFASAERRVDAHTLVAAILDRIIGYTRVHRLGLSPGFPLHAPLLSPRHTGMISHHQNLDVIESSGAI